MSELHKRSDEELMAAYQEGDRDCFAVLYERYRSPVIYYTRRFIGNRPAVQEDVFQEAFLKLHRSRHSFRSGARFRPWLYTIVHNLCVDRLRRLPNQREVEMVGDALDTSNEGDPEWNISRDQLRGHLDEALQHLSEQHRGAVVLFDVMGHTMAEVGEILGISVSNAKVSVFRGRRSLRRHLEKAAA